MLHEVSVNIRDGSAEGDPMPFSLAGATYYLRVFSQAQASGWVLILIVVRLLLSLGTWTTPKKFLVCWLLSGYLIVTLALLNKDPRYSAPLLPAVLLLANMGWNRLGPGARLSMLVVALALCFGTFAFLVGWWNSPAPWLFQSQEIGPDRIEPRREDWKIRECIDAISAARGEKARVVIGVLPQSEFFNHGTFRYFTRARRLPFEIREFSSAKGLREALAGLDYVVVKSGDQGPPHVTAHNLNFLTQLLAPSLRAITLVTVSLPDQSTAQVLELNPPAF